MKSIERPNTENSDNNNQWNILAHEKNNEEFFSEEASAQRINHYLNSINADDFMAVIRGYRKHLDNFQKKFSEQKFQEKYDNNPDLLNVYAFSSLIKDYLSKHLEVNGVDFEIKKEDYDNTKGGHLNIKEGKKLRSLDARAIWSNTRLLRPTRNLELL